MGNSCRKWVSVLGGSPFLEVLWWCILSMQFTKNIPIFNVVKVHLHIKEVDFIKFIFWHGWIQMNLSQLYYQIKEKCFLRHLWHLTKRFQRFLCILRWFLQHGILVRKFQFLSEVFARTSTRQRAVWENIFVDLLFFSVWSTSGNHCPLLVRNGDGGDHFMTKNGFWGQTLPNCGRKSHQKLLPEASQEPSEY